MYEAYIMGIFPRSDDLIAIWKRYEAGEVSKELFREKLSSSLEEVVKIQIDADLSYIHDPYIDWHDLFRPFTYLEGIEVGPITRYYENNVFYKKPVFKGEPVYPDGFILKYLHRNYLPKENIIATLPGPYTFYKLSEFNSNMDPYNVVSSLLRNAIIDMLDHGYSKIILAEPEIAYSKNIDVETIKELYLKIREVGDRVSVHLFFGDISNKVGLIESLPVREYSIDLQYTDLRNLECPKKKVTLGVVDGQNTLMEDISLVSSIIKEFRDRCSLDYIGISNNVDLDFLPYNIGVEKVYLLGKLFRRLRG